MAQSHHHILPLRVYLLVTAALFFMTFVTVAVSFVEFGVFNLLVAMLVAAVKAALVCLFFMHLKYDNKLYMTIFLAAIAFLGVFIFLTMADTMTRGDVDEYERHPINSEAVIYRNAAVDTTATAADTAGAAGVADTASAREASAEH